MADISVADIKALRDATGAGMMDAKKALVDADGAPTTTRRLSLRDLKFTTKKRLPLRSFTESRGN